MAPAIDWQKELSTRSISNTIKWDSIYGDNPTLIQDKKSDYLKLVQKFYETFGADRPVTISRAPGRVNLMGRHIDHQGGFINTVAIDKEILLAYSPRDDFEFHFHNMDSNSFPSQCLSPKSLFDVKDYSTWESFSNSDHVKEFNNMNCGNWSLYLLAVFYRLQLHFNHIELKGIDCFVSGNIPVGSGLSSSSALGVAFAKALLHVNQKTLSKKRLIELTGESELFVGFHGGKGDQAAIISANVGMVSKVGFYPFHISKTYPFPDGMRIIIAFSGESAKKGEGAQSAYNQRVASYAIGFKMLQQLWPPSSQLNHIRDLTPERIKLTTKDVLSQLQKLPNNPSRKEIKEFFNNGESDFLNPLFKTHKDPGNYDISGTLLFGISECARSENFHRLLKKNKLDQLMPLIKISHDGDRVLNNDIPTIDQILEQNKPMENISGHYGCSTEKIDQMVDIANMIPGTFGAQLAGAGLGGNSVVLVNDRSADHVMDALREKYYEPKNIPFDAHICVPISGASILGDSN